MNNTEIDKVKSDLLEIFYNKMKERYSDEFSKWNISIIDFLALINDRCYLCCSKLVCNNTILHYTEEENIKYNYRIRFACNICNRMKSTTPYDIFIKYCHNICSVHCKLDNAIFTKNILREKGNCDRYTDIKRKIEKAKHVFSITEDEYINLIFDNCYYCGNEASSQCINDVSMLNKAPGYTLNNCVTSCKICDNMKGRMNDNMFINHMMYIYYNTKCLNKPSLKNINVTNSFFRMYMQYVSNTCIRTDMLFDNVFNSTKWTVVYDCLNKKNYFFKIVEMNEIDNKTVTDEFMIENDVCDILLIGISQSNTSLIKTNITSEGSKNIDDISQNAYEIQQSSDIIFKIPNKQRCLQISVDKKDNIIVGITFRAVNEKCAHNSMMKVKYICSNVKVLGTDEQIKAYTNQYFAIKELPLMDKKRILQKNANNASSIFRKQREKKIIKKIGSDKFNKDNNTRVKKSQGFKKQIIGEKQYKEDKRDYMKSYRKIKKVIKIKSVKSTEKKREDVKTRKQKQRDSMVIKYGKDIYTQIMSLNTKLARAKKANKPDNELIIMKNELDRLKNI
jgi:hypothetical protein